MFLHAYSKDSDQTGWMPRLICILSVCTSNFVGFVMWWLICRFDFAMAVSRYHFVVGLVPHKLSK